MIIKSQISLKTTQIKTLITCLIFRTPIMNFNTKISERIVFIIGDPDSGCKKQWTRF